MSYKHFNLVINKEVELGFDDATERGIFLQCAYWADNRSIVRMSQSEISQETLYSLATIKRIFNRLEKKGYFARLGHGRYKIVGENETPNEIIEKNKLRRWINQKDNEALKSGSINLIEEELERQPPMLNEAIKKGWLKESERNGYIFGQDENGESIIHHVITYSIKF